MRSKADETFVIVRTEYIFPSKKKENARTEAEDFKIRTKDFKLGLLG